MGETQSGFDASRVRSMLDAAHLGIPEPAYESHLVALRDAHPRLTDHMSSIAVEEITESGTPAGAGIWCSTRLDCAHLSHEARAWLPLAAALAASDAVSGIRLLLAWPTDLVVQAAACGGAKGYGQLGSVRVTATDDGHCRADLAVHGDISARDLNSPGATSLLSEGADLDRSAFLGRYLIALSRRTRQLADAPQTLRRDYAERCITIGRLTEDGRVVTDIGPDAELVFA